MLSRILLVTFGLVCIFQVNGQIYRDGLNLKQPPKLYIIKDEAPIGYVIPEQPHIRARRQLFASDHNSTKDRTQTVGYKAGPAWGSLSQTFGQNGFISPITISGGADYTSPEGHGISGRIDTQPGIGSHLSARGQVGIINTPKHQLTGWAQHDRDLDKNFKKIEPETNSAGLNYLNKNNGASAFLSGSQTPGQPKTGAVGGNIPLYIGNAGNTRVDAIGQTKFGQHMKPEHQIGLQLTHNF